MDSTNPRRKQYQPCLVCLPTMLLSPIHRHSIRFHGQKGTYALKDEVPGYRLLYSQLRTNCPKSPLSPRITQNEPTVPVRAAKRCSQRHHALPHTHHLSRTYREGPC